MSYPAVLGYTENEVYLDKLTITLSSHLEHPHHPVAVVVDDFDGDAVGAVVLIGFYEVLLGLGKKIHHGLLRISRTRMGLRTVAIFAA